MMKIGKNIFLMKKRKKQEEPMADYDAYANDSRLSFDNIKDAENRLLIEELFELINEEDRNIIIMASLRYLSTHFCAPSRSRLTI